MKKITALIVALIMLCAMLQVSAADTTYIYVSPQGSDSNAGTYLEPVASLKKACELAADCDSAVINLMEGTYQVDETAVLGKNAGNTTIRAYEGGKVILTGSHEIDVAKIQKVADQEILDRIVEKKARDQIVAVDLKEAGITEYGEINMSGFGYPSVPMAPQLLVNGTMQTLARYPDDDYMMISQVVDPGVDVRNNTEGKDVMDYEGQGIKIRTSDTRISKWTKAKDVWMFGYFMHDWAEANLACTIDFDNKNTLCTQWPSVYGVTENRRFYCYNLLEEISKPGEWYLDRETGILYLYPEKTLTGSDTIEYITFNQPFISIDGAENVTIDGLQICKGLGMGISAENGKNITVSNCKFNDISSTVINMLECYDSTVTYCEFENVGSRGVYVKAGDRATLTPGNCVVSNCFFNGFSQIQPTSAPAIWLVGVGNTASHNEITDGKNIALWFSGNNHIIEYNDIYNVCTDTADTGAIYAGRDWTARGNEIRYNYIHDIGKIDTTTGMKVQAIYLDDMFSSAKVYGNIIKKVPSVALYGGGRYNTFENNLVLECSEPFVYDARGTTWMDCGEGSEIMNNLNKVPYTSDVWAKAYPELQNILQDDPQLPKHNVIKNNVSYKSPDYSLVDYIAQYGTVENNITINDTKGFVDYKNGDLTLKEDSAIFTKLPDFQPIDFKAIGIEEKGAAEKSLVDVLSASVILKVDTPETFVFGNAAAVDPANKAVVPMVLNDRTLVPVRFIAESFGGTVSWDEATQKVGIVCGDTTIELYIDQTELTVNGQKTELDVPAQVIEDRTMLPLRAVAESLGKTVFWDDAGLIVISDQPVLTETDADFVSQILAMF
ncbi:MAG: stalk domain-containing protein [Clostridia bacterium]|nr:stalk domain-containing protein [Clostridia bacterium]